jgi:hypothetical protein
VKRVIEKINEWHNDSSGKNAIKWLLHNGIKAHTTIAPTVSLSHFPLARDEIEEIKDHLVHQNSYLKELFLLLFFKRMNMKRSFELMINYLSVT